MRSDPLDHLLSILNLIPGRLSVLANQNSIAHDGTLIVEIIEKTGRLVSVFGPQHGFFSEVQDNMIESVDSKICTESGQTYPLYSLYSDRREPSPQQIDEFDTIIIDLQDIGCRIYTYMYSAFNTIKACLARGKRVVVVDRPNPVGLCSAESLADPSLPCTALSRVEGPALTPELEFSSFVSQHPIHFRHGLTMGELMLLMLSQQGIEIQPVFSPEQGPLCILRCQGMRPASILDSLTLHHRLQLERVELEPVNRSLFLPSPNMNSNNACYAFLATVLFEATNLSEGRGTTMPFLLIGAPWLRPRAVIDLVGRWNLIAPDRLKLESPRLLSHFRFTPTFNKYQGIPCAGLALNFNSEPTSHLQALGLVIALSCALLHPVHFTLVCVSESERTLILRSQRPAALGYEYNFDIPAVTLITGNSAFTDLLMDVKRASAARKAVQLAPTPDHAPWWAKPDSQLCGETSLSQSEDELIDASMRRLIDLLQDDSRSMRSDDYSRFWLY